MRYAAALSPPEAASGFLLEKVADFLPEELVQESKYGGEAGDDEPTDGDKLSAEVVRVGDSAGQSRNLGPVEDDENTEEHEEDGAE